MTLSIKSRLPDFSIIFSVLFSSNRNLLNLIRKNTYNMKGAGCRKPEINIVLPSNIPPQVQESLCLNGGIEGLSNLIMSQEMIQENLEIFKALADPFRMKILSLLSIQPLCVCVIREFLQISDTRLSYHLKKLSSTGLIEGNYQGNWIIYTLTDMGKIALSLCVNQSKNKSIN